LVLDVAETVLGVSGFSRRHLGFKVKPKNFIEELRQERSREIISELETLTGQIYSILVVVYSTIPHYSILERQQQLNKYLHKLIRLSEAYNIAVVVTNLRSSSSSV